MNNITIVTDSASDLSLKLMEEHNIKFAPITVDINGEIYLDKVNLDSTTFFEKIKGKDIFPKTAQVQPYAFEQIFEKELAQGNDIICITLSRELSGTNNSAHIAKAALESDRIHIIDSQTVTIGLGFLVYEAAKKVREGKNVEQIISYINKLIEKQESIIYIDTMEMLKRGGRISAAKATIGGMLGIKPMLTIKKGLLEPIDKAKGRKAAVKKMVEYIRRGNIDTAFTTMVAYSEDKAECDKLVKILSEEFNITDFMIGEIGPSVGSHSGPGALAVFFIKKS
jgi:DegV family protein with EDD domain